MPKYVRVKQKDTGHELSVTVGHYASNRDAYTEVKDRPAADPNGEPNPPKFKTTVDKSAAAKKATPSGQRAESEKETD